MDAAARAIRALELGPSGVHQQRPVSLAGPFDQTTFEPEAFAGFCAPDRRARRRRRPGEKPSPGGLAAADELLLHCLLFLADGETTHSPSSRDLAEFQGISAIILGCPTYMGSVSADMKRFMELTSRKYLDQAWSNKVAAGFTNSGGYAGDKLSTLMAMAVFAAQHGMTWVSLGLATGCARHDDNIESALNAIGAYLGAVSRSPVDVDASHGLTPGDRETGIHMGTRVARVTAQFIRGRTASG